MRDPVATIDELGGEDAWLAERMVSLGGSDAAPVLGIDQYRSPYQVWMEKTGQAGGFEENEAMRFGKLLEPIIADEFSVRTGWELVDPKALWRHPSHPFMHYTPDRLIRHPAHGIGLLEIKNRSSYTGAVWDDETPPTVTAQLSHGFEVLDLDWGFSAALIGGNKLVFYRVDRDAELGDEIIRREQDFWQLVLDGTPPPMDGMAQTMDLLNGAFVPIDKEQVELPDTLRLARAEYTRLGAEIKALEEHRIEVGNQLRAAMREATEATIDGELAVSWRQQASTRVDVKRLRDEFPDFAKQCEKKIITRVLRTHKTPDEKE